jgi:hypothetical protein
VALISHAGFAMFHLVTWEAIGFFINLDHFPLLVGYVALSVGQVLLLVPVSYLILRWTGNGSMSGVD